MAREYARVLKELGEEFLIIGRGEAAVENIRSELDIDVVSGGLTCFISENNIVPDSAIVCTPVETLSSITLELLDYGVKRILIEKPGALTVEELENVKNRAKKSEALVVVGYNRRFYQATLALEEKLKQEELVAANFEITEWSHLIKDEKCANIVKQKWVFSNTSHVIDLVQYIAGKFTQLSSYTSGSLNWHKSAARFVGSGISERGVLISYCGYWDCPGRWSVEFVTTKNRYIFRPMEKLQVQAVGSVAIEYDDTVNYELDEKFKPGIYLQTKAFLMGDYVRFVDVSTQIESLKIYSTIANYEK